jgi:aryl-alcohol dehydrogenase
MNSTVRTTAAVLRNADGPFELEDVELDEPGVGEVLVRIAGAGFCHTDLLPRTPLAKTPVIVGHEGSGVVEAVGPGVVDLSVGDHVVLSFDSCGVCANCLTARPGYCETFGVRNLTGYRPDGSTNARDAAGEPVAARWFGQSSFAGHCVVAARNVVRVDQDLPLELLGPLGCSVQTGAGAVVNTLAVRPGSGLVVFGAGAVGLCAVMAARVAGAGTIVAVDLDPQRLELAAELGATDVVDGAADDLAKQLRKLTGGGVECAFDTTGAPPVLAAAMNCLRLGGVCGTVAVQRGDLVLKPAALATRTLRSIAVGDAVPRTFIPELVALWRQGRLPFDKLITTYPLEKINEAERALHGGSVVKPVLLPS